MREDPAALRVNGDRKLNENTDEEHNSFID